MQGEQSEGRQNCLKHVRSEERWRDEGKIEDKWKKEKEKRRRRKKTEEWRKKEEEGRKEERRRGDEKEARSKEQNAEYTDTAAVGPPPPPQGHLSQKGTSAQSRRSINGISGGMTIMPTDPAFPHRDAQSDGVYVAGKGANTSSLRNTSSSALNTVCHLSAHFSHVQMHAHDNALDVPVGELTSVLVGRVGHTCAGNRPAAPMPTTDSLRSKGPPWRPEQLPAGAVMCEARDLGIKCHSDTPCCLKSRWQRT